MVNVIRAISLAIFTILIFFMSGISFSAPYEMGSGEVIKITVTAEVNQAILVPTESDCIKNAEIEGCDMLIPAEENPRHFCEDNPDALGCKYYKRGENE